jgi:Protein of unknown function (DUF2911)
MVRRQNSDLLPLPQMRNIMSRILFLLFWVALGLNGSAQFQITELDKSPMDMAYHPFAYPILKFQGKNPPAKPTARVIYSRPQKKGRVIFGTDIVKYNEIWRMGANECNEIELYRNATLGGKKIAKGRYSMFCIPNPDKWTIILNKDLDSWGAFSYKQANDLLRIDVPVVKLDEPVEFFTMVFDTNGYLVVAWDDVRVNVPFKYVL